MGRGIYDFDYIRRCASYADATLTVAVLCPADYQPGDPALELIEYVQPRGDPAETATNRPGNTHLRFVVSDIDMEVKRLQAAGASFKSPTANKVTWGINKGAKSTYFNGPDDIALELIEPVPAAVKKGACVTPSHGSQISVSTKELSTSLPERASSAQNDWYVSTLSAADSTR